jgi:hypothetical protein
MPNETLKDEYQQSAINWGSAILKGDSKSANRIHNRLNKMSSKLKKNESDYKLLLSGLIEHPEPSVRLVASIDALYSGINLQESETALNKLISDPNIGVLSLMALASLDSWRKKVNK